MHEHGAMASTVLLTLLLTGLTGKPGPLRGHVRPPGAYGQFADVGRLAGTSGPLSGLPRGAHRRVRPAGSAGWRLSGLVGQGSSLSYLSAGISVILGTLLVLLGVGYIGRVPLLRLEGSARWISRAIGRLLAARTRKVGVTTAGVPTPDRKSPASRAGLPLLGALNGLLPCGLVYGALLIAGSTANPWRGMLGMALFGAGTLPVMMIIVWGQYLQRAPAQDHDAHRRAFLVVVGLQLLLRGFAALESSVTWALGSDAMVSATRHENCALCGQEIIGEPIVQHFDGEEKHFCCKGAPASMRSPTTTACWIRSLA